MTKNILKGLLSLSSTVKLLAGCMAMASFAFVSCDNRNIHQVVREIAQSPVDTVGWPNKQTLTNPFSAVDIDCFADVTFHQTPVGSDHFVEIKAPRKVLENIAMRVEDGTLHVDVDRRYRMPDKAVAVVNIYAPFVNRFILDGGKCLRLGKLALTCPLELMVDGNVGTMVADSVTAHEVSLQLSGSGSFDLKGFNTGAVRAKVAGDGRVFLSGKCTTVKMRIKGNGKIHIPELQRDSILLEEIVGGGKILK